MADLHRLTAARAAQSIRAGAVSPVDLLEACLGRIDRWEPRIKAWASIDVEAARRTAAARAQEARDGRLLGPLHGVPVGLKDIYHATGFVTTAGAGPFFHRRPDADAEAVARLRRAGAVVLGKTTTTEFANRDPAPTANPWNLEHTPGGSSSGSAAAVASGMVPLALGSQTVGSTLRPAAYCGIVGFKATYGRVSCAGMVPLAWSFDTVGFLGRTVADVRLALDVLAGYDDADLASIDVPAVEAASARPPVLGVARSWTAAAPAEMAAHLDDVAERCRRAGAMIRDVELPETFDRIADAGQQVVRAEAAAFHADHFPAHADRYRAGFRATLEAGVQITTAEYLGALRHCRRFRRDMGRALADVDALLVPVAPGPAPRGLESTGDASFCAPWSSAGLPAIALPSGVAGDGLPIGVQLVAGPLRESNVLAAAEWLEALIGFRGEPALG